VSIVLNNSDGRFTGDWFFSKGDALTLAIGYDSDLVPVGEFTIDQIEATFGPDTLTVRALAAGVNSPLRTKRSVAHEGKTIREIAQTVADANSYTINDGTSSTRRIKQDWTSERTDLTATRDAINLALATVSAPSAVGVSVSVSNALNLYAPTIAAADRLTAKGRSEDGTEIRQTCTLWRAAWINRQIPEIRTTVGIARDFAARLTAIIASLVDVDQTITRSKLDTVVSWHTQDNETDLAYLERISKDYGVIFSVRGTVMIFTSVYDVEAAPVADTITRADVTSAAYRDSAVKNYRGVRVIWHDPETGEAVTSELTATEPDGQPRSGDTLEIRTRAETQAQADEIAKSRMHQMNSKELEGDLTLPGRPLLCAGVNVNLRDFGVFDGKWNVTESSHTIEVGGGYTMTVRVKSGR
jgi:phage protein D